jgi:hypothetical protein
MKGGTGASRGRGSGVAAGSTHNGLAVAAGVTPAAPSCKSGQASAMEAGGSVDVVDGKAPAWSAATYWYLSAEPELLRAAANRLEAIPNEFRHLV